MKITLAKYKEHEFTIDVPFSSKRELNEAKKLFKQKNFPNRNKRAPCYEFYLQYCTGISDVEYIKPYNGITINKMIKKYGEDEGRRRFKEWKDNGAKSRTLSGYEEKFGKEYGRKKYLEKNSKLSVSESALMRTGKSKEEIKQIRNYHAKKSGHSLESYIIRHGEQGEEYYNNYRESMKFVDDRKWPSQIKFWTSKGYTESEAHKLVSDFQRKDIDYYIKKYGEKDGINRYNKSCKNKAYALTLNGYVSRFGETEGRRLYKEKTKRLSYCQSIHYYIDKYGYYDGSRIYNDLIKRKCTKSSIASKESLILFKPLYKILRRKYNIPREDIYWGINGSSEYFINDDGFHLYDFTIRSKKIIIEYHGEAFHPNIKWKDTEKWNNWRCLFTNETADEKYKFDQFKKNKAIKNGFSILEVWSSDEDKIYKCIEFIKGKN